MFEIKKEEYVHKCFRFSRSLIEELARCAASYQISMNFLVAQCCRYALDQMMRDESGRKDIGVL